MKPPPVLNLEGSLAENWRKWEQRFNLYLVASGIGDKTAKVQASTLLHVIGPNALDIYNTFARDAEGNEMKVDKIIEKFKAYCNPRKNITYERHVFNTRNQKAGDSIDQYVTDLRTKAKTCEFGTLCESLIRDRVVCGIMNNMLHARLLRESELTLKTAIDICRATEVSLEQAKSLTSTQEEMSLKINAVKRDQQNGPTKYKYRKNNTEKRHPQNETVMCGRCGGKHG